MTNDKSLRIKFDRHGLGDVCHWAHAVQLYKRRGYDVTIQAEENKLFVWKVAGVNIVQGGGLPDHSYHYPAGFDDLNQPDCLTNKVAFGLQNSIMPPLEEWPRAEGQGLSDGKEIVTVPSLDPQPSALGDSVSLPSALTPQPAAALSPQRVWDELCQVRLSAHDHIPPEAHAEAEKFLEGMPSPIICIHSRGTNWHEHKSIPTDVAFDVIVKLLDQTSGSVIVLDFDRRAPMVGDARCKGIKPGWGHIGIDRLCALFERSDLVIGVDSGPFHVAALTNIKALGVFRSLHPNRVCLPNPNAVYLVSGQHAEQWQRREDRWNTATFADVEPTSDEIVFAAIQILRNGALPMPQLITAAFAGWYDYYRVNHDRRRLELCVDGRVGDGLGACEQRWFAMQESDRPAICITGEHGVICTCRKEHDGVFRGAWTKFERMPIELRLLEPLSSCHPSLKTNVSSTRTIVYDSSHDAAGLGDAMLNAWISEGTRGLQHHADASMADLLRLFGQKVVQDPIGDTIDFDPAYKEEKERHGTLSRLRSRLNMLGDGPAVARPKAYISEADLAWARDSKARNCPDGKPFIVLCPQTPDPSRQWLANYWADLNDTLKANGYGIVTFMAHKSHEHRMIFPHHHDESIGHWVALLSLADLVVCPDSCAAHIAGTLGRKCLVLCGPTVSDAVFGYLPTVEAIAVSGSDQHCVGCHYLQEFHDACYSGCWAMQKITPENVAARIYKIFGSRPDAQSQPSVPIAMVMNWDSGFDDIASIVLPNRRDYATKHGYSLKTTHFHGSWGKIDALLAAWNDADWLWYLDTDACITNPKIRIEDLIPENASVAVTCDRNGINAGSLLMRTDECVRAILSELLTRRSEFDEKSTWFEQTGLAYLLWKIRDVVRVVPQQRMNAYPHTDEAEKSYEWQPGDFVLHCAGTPKEDRLRILTEACCEDAR